MRLPLTDKSDTTKINLEETVKMADHFLANGFTYFDTAYPYHRGQSEQAFKKAVVQRHPRESFTIADKMPVWLVKETSDYQRYFNEQLERCGVSFFDYYMLHSLRTEPYENTLKYGGFDFIAKLKAEGKARKVGFSFHDKADVLDRILTEPPEVDFVQLQINYIDWDNPDVQSGKNYETALKHGKQIIVMEPVKGGCLASLPEDAEKLLKSHNSSANAASWAIRFAASLENILVVLSGMSSMEQMKENASFMKDFKAFTKEEKNILDRAAGIISGMAAIPCTNCAYCVEDCSQKISIPDLLSLYNNYKRYGPVQDIMNGYRFETSSGGKASACIACKKCEEHCPQHIPVTEWMKEIAKIFESA
jgi:predicted aldo/keto reductase-like oxidoreductase